eukprot:5440769-Lingulodinium_polyedra.AAC.1
MQQLGRGRGPGGNSVRPLCKSCERPNRVALVALHDRQAIGHGLGKVGPVCGRHSDDDSLLVSRGRGP